MKLVYASIFLLSFQCLGQATQQMTLEQMRRDLARIDKSLTETKAKIQEVKDARFLPELYFALAEFYVDKGRYMYLIKVAENPKTPLEELDLTAEKRPKLEAIEVYDTIIEKFPKIADRDKALFFKGHEQHELGRLEDMVRTYSQLTREYPDSEYWTESQVILGDYFFENKKDLDFSIELYKKILSKPPSPFTPLAHYKLGWCYINKNEFKTALLEFEKVLSENKDVDLSKLPDIYRKTDVRREAIIALVWPYSELNEKDFAQLGGDVRNNPLKYFYQISPDATTYEKVLSKLGKRLILKQRLVETTQVYFEILRITKELSARIDAVESLYTAMKNSQKPWPVHGLVQAIAETLPKVMASPELKKAEKDKIQHDWEIYARDVATRSQKRAKETRDATDWDWTIRDYIAYLSVYPNTPEANALRLNLAESYFTIGKSVEAARSYEDLASRTKDKNQKKEYLDSAIQSYITALRSQSELTRLQLTEVRFGLREVGTRFIKTNPNDKASADIRFNIAQTYYDERNFNAAVKNFEAYINKYPDSPNQAIAANLILDSYNQREDYKGLVRKGNELLKNKNIKDEHLKEQIRQIVQQGEMRQVQNSAGDFGSKDYAANLLKLAHKYKGSSMGDQALYEAFIALKSKKDPKAYEAGEQLLLQHSKSKYSREVVNAMGQMALLTADFRRAAIYFELFYDRYPEDPGVKDLLKNAAQIREQMGDFKIAARDYQKLGDFDKAARQDFVAGDWAALIRSSGRTSGINAPYYEGLAQYRLRGLGPARSLLEKAASTHSTNYEDQEKAAHALYLLSMAAMANYRDIQMHAGEETKNVQEKSGLLTDLDAKLKAVIAFGNGRWTIAALYGLGLANKEFADFIKKAPLPAGLTPDQQKQFQTVLATKASQYDTSAKGFFDQCQTSAEKFEVLTRFALGCQSQGALKVDEAQEVAIVAQASETEPAGTDEVRKKLFDQPRSLPLLFQLSNIYLKAKDYAAAGLVLSRASEIEPNNKNCIARMGVIKLYTNELAEAKALFEKATANGAGDALGYWGLAGLYHQFHFERKFKELLTLAKAAGRPSGPTHPYIDKILN